MEWLVLGLWMASLLIGIALVGVDVPPVVRKRDDVLGEISKRPRLAGRKRILHNPLPFLDR